MKSQVSIYTIYHYMHFFNYRCVRWSERKSVNWGESSPLISLVSITTLFVCVCVCVCIIVFSAVSVPVGDGVEVSCALLGDPLFSPSYILTNHNVGTTCQPFSSSLCLHLSLILSHTHDAYLGNRESLFQPNTLKKSPLHPLISHLLPLWTPLARWCIYGSQVTLWTQLPISTGRQVI